jgi:hypothetical protein
MKKIWRIKINHPELTYIEYTYYKRYFIYFKEMGRARRLHLKRYVEDNTFHEFKYYILFSNMLLCVSFYIVYREYFDFKTIGIDNTKLFTDFNEIEYYLAEFISCVTIPLYEIKDYILDTLIELRQCIQDFYYILTFRKKLIKDKEYKDIYQIVFEIVDHKITYKKLMLK